jgi:hypothetical protein
MEKVPDERSESGIFYLAHHHRMAERSDVNTVIPTLPATAHAMADFFMGSVGRALFTQAGIFCYSWRVRAFLFSSPP